MGKYIVKDEFESFSPKPPKIEDVDIFAFPPPIEPRTDKKATSVFKNIFWGNRQQAWMGSVRANGTTVRSCSRKSDVIAAKILNTRCAEKGLPPPNPWIGFLNQQELLQQTIVGKTRKKRQSCSNSPKKNKRTKPKKKSRFKNIFWGNQQQAWMGNIRVKGTIVRSCSRASDVLAAQILNSRCLEKGIKPPNPEVGFVEDVKSSVRKRQSQKKVEDIKSEKNFKLGLNLPPVSGQYVSDMESRSGNCFAVFNNNTFDPFLTAHLPPLNFEPTPYQFIFWSHREMAWVGQFQGLEAKTQTSPEECAKLLNQLCSDKGYPLPNPMAGFLKPMNLNEAGFYCPTAEENTTTYDSSVRIPTLFDFKNSKYEDLILPPVCVKDNTFSATNALLLDFLEKGVPCGNSCEQDTCIGSDLLV